MRTMTDKKTKTRRKNEIAGDTVLLREEEAAKFLNVSPRTLQGWRVTGGGPPFVKYSNRCVRYRQEDLDQWIEERTRRSTADPG